MAGVVFGGEAPANTNFTDAVDYTLANRFTPASSVSLAGIWVFIADSAPGASVMAAWDDTGALIDTATVGTPVLGAWNLATFVSGGPYAWPAGEQWAIGYYTPERYVATGSRLPATAGGITADRGYFHENTGPEAGTPIYPTDPGGGVATWYGIDIELAAADIPVIGSDTATLTDAATLSAAAEAIDAAALSDLAAMVAALGPSESWALTESATRTIVGAARTPGRPVASSSAAGLTSSSSAATLVAESGP